MAAAQIRFRDLVELRRQLRGLKLVSSLLTILIIIILLLLGGRIKTGRVSIGYSPSLKFDPESAVLYVNNSYVSLGSLIDVYNVGSGLRLDDNVISLDVPSCQNDQVLTWRDDSLECIDVTKKTIYNVRYISQASEIPDPLWEPKEEGLIGLVDETDLIKVSTASGIVWDGRDIGAVPFLGDNYQLRFDRELLALSVNNNANLGVGTPTPEYKLDVGGDIRALGSGIFDNVIVDTGIYSNPSYTFRDAIDTGIFYDGNQLGFTTRGESRMVIDNNGNIGINTRTPQALLHIVQATKGNVRDYFRVDVPEGAGIWRYRRVITISNPNKYALTDFPVRIDIDLTQDIVTGKTSRTCSDLVFWDPAENKYVDFFIEDCSTDSLSTIWVKISNIGPLEKKEIIMYEGAIGTAKSMADPTGQRVFTFFDHFEYVNLDNLSTNWKVISKDLTVADSVVTIHTGYIIMNAPLPVDMSDNYIVEWSQMVAFRPESSMGVGVYSADNVDVLNSRANAVVLLGFKGDIKGVWAVPSAATGNRSGYDYAFTPSSFSVNSNIYGKGVFEDYAIKLKKGGSVDIIYNSAVSSSASWQGFTKPLQYIWLGTFATSKGAATTVIDWIRVRKIADNTPTVVVGDIKQIDTELTVDMIPALVVRDSKVGLYVTGELEHPFQIGDPEDRLYGVAYGWYQFSDERLKVGITPLESSDTWGLLEKVDVFRYRWKEDSQPDIGFIAQQIEQVLPQAVIGTRTKAVDYSKFVPLLVDAVKDLDTRVRDLQAISGKPVRELRSERLETGQLTATEAHIKIGAFADISTTVLDVADSVYISNEGITTTAGIRGAKGEFDDLTVGDLKVRNSGRAVVSTGNVSATVTVAGLDTSDMVFVNQTSGTPVPFVVDIEQGRFTIRIGEPSTQDLQFIWMVVKGQR